MVASVGTFTFQPLQIAYTTGNEALRRSGMEQTKRDIGMCSDQKIFRLHCVPARHKSLFPEVNILALVCKQVNAFCPNVSRSNQGADELFNLEISGSTIAPKAVPLSQNHPSTHLGKHTYAKSLAHQNQIIQQRLQRVQRGPKKRGENPQIWQTAIIKVCLLLLMNRLVVRVRPSTKYSHSSRQSKRNKVFSSVISSITVNSRHVQHQKGRNFLDR